MLWSNDTVHVWNRNGSHDTTSFAPSDLFLRQAEAALRFCSGEPPAVTFTQALRATAIADAVVTAAAAGATDIAASLATGPTTPQLRNQI
jgi:hypothetical protein